MRACTCESAWVHTEDAVVLLLRLLHRRLVAVLRPDQVLVRRRRRRRVVPAEVRVAVEALPELSRGGYGCDIIRCGQPLYRTGLLHFIRRRTHLPPVAGLSVRDARLEGLAALGAGLALFRLEGKATTATATASCCCHGHPATAAAAAAAAAEVAAAVAGAAAPTPISTPTHLQDAVPPVVVARRPLLPAAAPVGRGGGRGRGAGAVGRHTTTLRRIRGRGRHARVGRLLVWWWRQRRRGLGGGEVADLGVEPREGLLQLLFVLKWIQHPSTRLKNLQHVRHTQMRTYDFLLIGQGGRHALVALHEKVRGLPLHLLDAREHAVVVWGGRSW